MNGTEGWSTTLSKLLIAFFLVLAAVTAAFCGVTAYKIGRTRRAQEEDARRLKMIQEAAPRVQALAEAGYTEEKLREEQQTGNWTSFFASAAQVSGLDGTQYRLPNRKTAKGRGFLEHSFEIRINPKTGVTRQIVARFLHTIESRRTYLKTRSVHIKQQDDSEDWGGTVVVAYREKG